MPYIRRKRTYRKKSMKPRRKTMRRSKSSRKAVTNVASIRENFTTNIADGTMTFFRNVQLANGTYDRAQTVAQAYQEFKVRYIKFTFRPSADTFPIASGNTIPQIYFQVDKANTVPINASQQTLLDMGVKPIRFDDKNIVRSYRPNILYGVDTTGVALTAGAVKPASWLSTNANAADPTTVWAPSAVDHIGCCLYVTKPNPLTPTISFVADVEVVFDFRKPLWRRGDGDSAPPSVRYIGDMPQTSQ